MVENLDSKTSKRIDRRRLLEMGAVGLGATIISACSSSPSTSTAPSPAATTASSGASTAATAAPTTAAAATTAASPAATTAAAPTTAASPAAQAAATSVPTQAAAVNTGATTGQPVTITFNTWWVPLQDVIKTFTTNFQDANPGVTVKSQFITTSYADKMSAALVAGNFGDAATGDNGIDSKWQSGGYHYDLTDYLKQDGIDLQKDYSLGGLELWCGKALSLPMDNDDRAIYYNKTMIKAAGAKDPWDDLHGKWTWDDMLEIAAACTKKDSSGKISQYGLMVNYDDTEEFEPFVWSLGGNYADWNTGKYNYLDPAVVKAQQLLYKWATQDKVMITQEAISNLQGASGVNPFRAGIVAMYHRASYDATLNQKEIGNKFEWDAAPFPDPGSFNQGKPGVPCSTANPQFVPKSAKNPIQGYKWLAYMCGDVAENTYAKNKTMMVAKLSAWKTYQDTQPPAHPGSFVYYVYSRPHGFHYYSDIMNEVMYSIVQPELDKAYLGQETIEKALQNAQNKINTLGKSQSASCGSPYGQQGSPRAAISDADLNAIGVHAYNS